MFIPIDTVSVYDAVEGLWEQYSDYDMYPLTGFGTLSERENCVKEIRSKLAVGAIKAVGLSFKTSKSINIQQSYWLTNEAEKIFEERCLIQFIDESGRNSPPLVMTLQLSELRKHFHLDDAFYRSLEIEQWTTEKIEPVGIAKRTVTIIELQKWYQQQYIPEMASLNMEPNFDEDLEAVKKKFPNKNIPVRRFRQEVRVLFAPKNWSRINKKKRKN